MLQYLFFMTRICLADFRSLWAVPVAPFLTLLALRLLRLLLPQGTPSGQRFIPKNPVPGAKSKRLCTITQNLAR